MISRPIKEGFRGVGRHWGMSISSAIAVTITLSIISLFLIFTANVANFTQNVEAEMQISVMIDYDYESDEQLQEIGDAIRGIEGVKEARFTSKEEELEYYISLYDGDTRELFETYRENNPMHHAYYVEVNSGDEIANIANQISSIEGIYEVNYGGQSTQNMMSVINVIRRVGVIMVAILTLLAIFLIQNTIKLTISAREDEITIMRNVGATNSFIRSPFVIEGIITGVMGSIIPIVITIYGYEYLYTSARGVLVSSMFRLVQPRPFVFVLSAVLLGIGVLVGLIGSWLSVTKYLRWKR